MQRLAATLHEQSKQGREFDAAITDNLKELRYAA